jgi:hypothetical protein
MLNQYLKDVETKNHEENQQLEHLNVLIGDFA